MENDPYIDDSAGILRNKLGITTEKDLFEIESQITTIEIANLTTEHSFSLEKYGFSIIPYIHKRLFRHIYDWAGQFRSIEMSKGGTHFAFSLYIQKMGDEIFDNLATEHFLENISDRAVYASKLAHYYSELNILHPFREGNGRTVRTFLSILAKHSGYNIAWNKMSRMENIRACEEAYHGNETQLEAKLYKIIDSL